MCYLSDLHFPLPNVFEHIAEFVQNRGVRNTLKARGPVDVEALRRYLSEAKSWEVPLDQAGIAHVFEDAIEDKIKELATSADPGVQKLQEIISLVSVARHLPFPVHLGMAQNRFFAWLQSPVFRERHVTLMPWVEQLAQELQVRVTRS
jgi:hypothetical protein